jgi:O-antigen/teichoic acid export membrane protein
LIVIIFGRAGQFILALAMMRVATTLLSPREMGRVSLVLTTIAFFALFLINPVGMFINRRLHAWQANGVVRHYLTRYLDYLILVGLLSSIILLLVAKTGQVNFGIPAPWLIVLVFGSIVFNTINQTSIPSLNLLGHSRWFVFLSVSTLSASFIFATLLVELLSPSAQYWVLGLLLGQLLLGFVGTKVLFSQLPNSKIIHEYPTIQKGHFQALFRFAWPVAISAGLGWVQSQGYRYILKEQLGFSQLGLFIAGYGISAGMISAFESILTTYFQPRLYRDVNTDHIPGQIQAWQRYALAVIPALLLTVAFIIILAPELTRIFLGANFQSAKNYVVWGAFAEAARVLMGVYSMIAHVYMRTQWLILPGLVGAVLSVVLCIELLPGFGAAGAGIGLSIAGFSAVMTMHLMLAGRMGGGIPIRPLFVAGISAVGLWGITIGLRRLLEETNWTRMFEILILIGITYSGMLYLFLREYLEDRKKA